MVDFAETAGLSRAPTRVAASDVAIAAAGALAGGALVALAGLCAPTRVLEALAVHSGLAALVNAAAPPLGFTARLLIAVAGGVLAGGIGWAVLVLIVGERRVRVRRPAWRMPTLPSVPRIVRRSAPDGQSVRRTDSHPDAPPRPPILAGRELGVPFLSIVADVSSAVAPAVRIVAAAPSLVEPKSEERPLPALDTTLAAVDPGAIPDVPRTPVPTIPSLVVTHPAPPVPRECSESIAPEPDVRERPDSIEGLLARLERGTRRRAAPAEATTPVSSIAPVAPATIEPAPPAPFEPEPVWPSTPTGSLDEMLLQLRRLATRR